MPFGMKYFNPRKIFENKRVAVVGPADSAFDSENGKNIDGYDYIIRINKALVTWNKENEKYLGTRTDILIHNFHENMDKGGGGPLDMNLYKSFGVRYVIQPRFDSTGLRDVFNYFKKYLDNRHSIYIFPFYYYKRIKNMFAAYHPTRGFCALYASMTSPCKEVFITGFTFFKTPYAEGYRDDLREVTSNKDHILKQGFHNMDLEYANFLKLLQANLKSNIVVDENLYAIIKADSPELANRVNKIKN